MKILFKRYFLLFFVSLFFACSGNKFDVDTSQSKVEAKIMRLDLDLFNINKKEAATEIQKLKQKYGSFFDIYCTRIVPLCQNAEQINADIILRFISDHTVRSAFDSCYKEFPRDYDFDNLFSEAFSYYKFYFPQKNIPTVYTYISSFNYAVVTDSAYIGVGLDMYLGNRGSDFYNWLQIYNYNQANMHKSRIVADCMKAWAKMEFPYNDSIDNLLSKMIYEGRTLYFLDAMLPHEHDSLKIAYTNKQLSWCRAYEKDIWDYIIEQKILFSQSRLEIAKMIDNAPFSAYFGQNSAPRTGVFIGWQIVKAFAERNKNTSLNDLMKITNYQYILDNSHYKP